MKTCGQNLAGHAQFSRDPQSQFIVTAALIASATVLLPTGRNLLGRADHSNAAAEVKVVVVERGVKNTCHGATDSQQQHGQCAAAQTMVVIIVRARRSRSCTLAGCDLFRSIAGAEL